MSAHLHSKPCLELSLPQFPDGDRYEKLVDCKLVSTEEEWSNVLDLHRSLDPMNPTASTSLLFSV